MVKVAVHIVTYNNAKTIVPCLESVLAQSGEFDILVVDNASQDETVALVQHLDVPVICNPTNRGYAHAHNRAIAHTTSDYVLTLNPDVVLRPGFITAMIARLDAQPDIGSACGCLLRIDDIEGEPYCVDSNGVYMRRTRRQGLRGEGTALDERSRTPATIFGPDGAAAFYRRTMLEDIQVLEEIFDEDFFIHKEDVDICWRAQLYGWSAIYVPEATAHHIRTFRPGQRRSVSPILRYYSVRNRYLLLLKNESARNFWRDGLFIAVYEVAIVIYLMIWERSSLRAFASAWRLRRRMMMKRRVIQQRRRDNPAPRPHEFVEQSLSQ